LAFAENISSVQKVSVQSILVIILYVLNNKKYKSIKFKVKSFKKKAG